MAEKLRGIPFDANEIILPDGSAGYDNVLYSADFAEWMQTYFKNGILVPGGALISTELEVTKLDDTHVQVNVGNAVVNGRTTFVKSPISLLIDKAGPDLERRDRIVIELNLATAINSFRLLIVKGTMSATPNTPDLVRNDEVYQISLATLSVNQAGVYSITDDRPNESLCGISQVLIGVRPPLPTTGDEANNIAYNNDATGVEATTVQDALDIVLSPEKVVTLLSSGWEEDKTQTVQLSGITPNTVLIVDILATNRDESNLWGNIWKVETLNNSLKFYSAKVINIDLTVKIKAVR